MQEHTIILNGAEKTPSFGTIYLMYKKRTFLITVWIVIILELEKIHTKKDIITYNHVEKSENFTRT